MSKTLQLETLQLEEELESIFKQTLPFPVPKSLIFVLTTGVGILKGHSYASDLGQLEYSAPIMRRALYVLSILAINLYQNVKIDKFIKVGNLVSHLLFLINGRNFNLLSLAFNLRLVNVNKLCQKYVSFDYLNRNLFWQQFTALLNELKNIKLYNPKTLFKNGCGYCGQECNLKHKSNCDHDFCYYCVASNMDKNCPVKGCSLKIISITLCT